ncbi:MAG: hypothetical protein R3C58_01820 [Parvularculaceae bacterium]
MGEFVPVIYGRPDDRPDELDSLRNAQVVAETLARLGYATDMVEVDLDLSVLERLAKKQPFVVFNLVEGIRGDGALGHLAGAALDHLRVPYTGASTDAYQKSASKILTKMVLEKAGLPTARWWRDEAPSPLPSKNGPGRVIVKSVSEHASFGMDQKSVVDRSRAMDEIAAREKKFGGAFFCEDYIPGREFNISVLEMRNGPKVMPLAEMLFDDLPEGVLPIIDYTAKWDEAAPSYQLTQRRFAAERDEPELAKKLHDLTLACWRAADLSGYARVDFRVAPDGAPYILEFNANPCLAPDAGFAAALAEAGIGYDEGIAAIVEAARPRSG